MKCQEGRLRMDGAGSRDWGQISNMECNMECMGDVGLGGGVQGTVVIVSNRNYSRDSKQL